MREFIDGFETGNFSLWDARDGYNDNISIVAGFTSAGGSKALYLQSPGRYLQKYLTARDEYYVAFLYKFNVLDTAGNFFNFMNGSTILGSLYHGYNATVLTATKGPSFTSLGVGTKQFTSGQELLIEINYKPATDATGKFIVKINGIIDLNLTNIISASNALQIDRIQIGGNVHNTACDNIIVDSSEWIGNTKITGVTPSASGNYTQWTPSAGDNYDCVNEIPASDTDYVSTNTIDMIDTYAMGNMPSEAVSIKCVSSHFRAKTEGAPTPTKIAPVFRIGGTDYIGTENIISTSFLSYSQVWENNPATSSSWAVNEVNSLEGGVKSRA